MNFVFAGDFHFRMTPPENRTDDFIQAQRNKMEEILDICIKNRVRALLHPGDFWDIANPPLDFVAKTLSLLSNEEISEEDLKLREIPKPIVDMIGIVGNHEEFGNNINSIPKTMAGFLGKLGIMKYVTKKNPFIITTEDGLKIAITGSNYNLDMDTPDTLNEYIVEEKLGDVHIHIVHGMLSDKSLGPIMNHTTIDMIKHTKADITLCGHDHMGFKMTEIDGKYFLNPGAIPRLKNDLRELKRKPKVYLVSITKENGIEIKTKYLKSAQPGELVLSRAVIEAKKDKERQLEEFKNTVKVAEIEKGVDINEIIKKVGDNKGISKDMITEILDKVSEKIEKLGSNNTVRNDVIIEKLVLENYKSYIYQEFEFTNGFNLLTGESGHGKSNVLKAFEFVYENKGKSKRVVRRGCNYTKVTVYLSNGYIITRIVELKSGGRNGYEIYDPNTQQLEYFNTKYLPEVQKILGYSTLKIDDDLNISLNFMRQGTSWFLISENYSGPKKAKIIGAIYGTQYSDAVLRDYGNIEQKLIDTHEKIQENVDSIDKDLQKYLGLEHMKERISKLKDISKELKDLKEKKKVISELFKQREAVSKELDKIVQTLNESKNIEFTSNMLIDLKSDLILKNNLETLLNKKISVENELKIQNEIIKRVENTSKAKKILGEAKKISVTRELLEKKVSLEKNLKEQQDIVNKFKNIEESKKSLVEIETLNVINQKLIKKNELKDNLLKQQEILKFVSNTKKARKYFNNISNCQDRIKAGEEVLKRIRDLKSKKIEIEKQLKEQNSVMNKYQNIQGSLNSLDSIKQMLVTRNDAINCFEKKENIITVKNINNDSIKKIKATLKGYALEYKQVLRKEKECPICASKLDDKAIEKIISEKIAH